MTLPVFPTDDFTLTQLEHDLSTGIAIADDLAPGLSERDVIRALLARVRELAAECTDLRREVAVLTAERDAALYARDTAAAQTHSGGS